MNSKERIWNVSGNGLLWILVMTLPFSIAVQSISLVLMILWGMCRYIFAASRFDDDQTSKQLLIWLVIPLVYLFSLIYSKNFTHGWRQWLILMPVWILPIYLSLARRYLHVKSVILGFGLVSSISVVLHGAVSQHWLTLPIKSVQPMSLFFTSTINALMWWAALLALVVAFPMRHVAHVLTIVLCIGLMYFGELGLLVLAIIVMIYFFGTYPRWTWLAPVVFIGLPCICIAGLVFFERFAIHADYIIESVLNVYKKNEWPAPVANYVREFQFSIAQWWKHVFNGVGLGDYVDAMWNEYHDHQLTMPPAPAQQIGHMLVSTGLLTVVAMYGIVKRYLQGNRRGLVLLSVSVVCLVFYAPFVAQTSACAFMLPVLFISLLHE